MEIGANFNAAVSYRVSDVLEIINGKFLWYHINDLVAGRNVSTVLVFNQPVDFFLLDLLFHLLANDIASGLQALDVVACNTYINFTNAQFRI